MPAWCHLDGNVETLQAHQVTPDGALTDSEVGSKLRRALVPLPLQEVDEFEGPAGKTVHLFSIRETRSADVRVYLYTQVTDNRPCTHERSLYAQERVCSGV